VFVVNDGTGGHAFPMGYIIRNFQYNDATYKKFIGLANEIFSPGI